MGLKQFVYEFITSLQKSSKKIRKEYFVFDVESDTSQQWHKFLFANVLYRDDDYVKRYDFYSPKEITDWFYTILNKAKYKNKHYYLFGHNVSYDIRLALDKDYFLTKQNTFIFLQSTSPFIFTFGKYNRNNKFVVLDTMNYFKVSLEGLANMFGQTKVQVDFSYVNEKTFTENKEIRQLVIDRCKKDVELTDYVVSFLYDNFDKKVSVSLPQLAFRVFRADYQRFQFQKLNSNLIAKSYYGGRTELFRKGKHHVYIYDVNSMYPFQYLKPLPVKLYCNAELERKVKSQSVQLDKQMGYSAHVKLKVNEDIIAPFPYRANKLIFPNGIFDTYLCADEFNNAYENGYIQQIYNVEIYEMDYLLKDFALNIYQKRQESSGLWKAYYKLLLNSLYGKFGQKRKTAKIIDYNGNKDTCEVVTYYDDNGKMFEVKNIFGVRVIEKEQAYRYSVAISAFITAYARHYLYMLMQPIENHIIYCDTDSIVIDIPYPNSNLLHDSELGKLKLEYEGEFEGLRPKFYYRGNKLKLKGVPEQSEIEISDNQYIAKYLHWYQIKETMNKQKWGVKVEQVEKVVNIQDDKRLWLNDTYSKPIIINNAV